MNCTTTTTHCENCGSTSYENLTGNQGYSACCNELIVNSDCRGHHVVDTETHGCTFCRGAREAVYVEEYSYSTALKAQIAHRTPKYACSKCFETHADNSHYTWEEIA